MKPWLILLTLLAACSQAPPHQPLLLHEDIQPQLLVPKAERKCDITVPDLVPPVTSEKVQQLLDTYDGKLKACADIVTKLIYRIRKYNDGIT